MYRGMRARQLKRKRMNSKSSPASRAKPENAEGEVCEPLQLENVYPTIERNSTPLSLMVSNLFEETLEEVKEASHQLLEEAQKGISKIYYTFQELPSHMQDNEFIHSGYRAYYSAMQCLSSLFRIHNETMNIWTHLLGAFVYFAIIFLSFHFVPPEASFADRVILSIFLISATQCLFCSSAYHTFCAHKHFKTYEKFQIMDYCGISCLVCGSFLTYLHYGFYQHLSWRIFYYVIIGCLGTFGLILPWFSFFRRVNFRIWRAVYYVLMGTCLFGLCCHAFVVAGGMGFVRKIGWDNLVLELFFYLCGAAIYAARYPERFFPGRLDIFFHSHQIWHVFILIASTFHLRGTLNLMKFHANKSVS